LRAPVSGCGSWAFDDCSLAFDDNSAAFDDSSCGVGYGAWLFLAARWQASQPGRGGA
jgi:hypothetical protein